MPQWFGPLAEGPGPRAGLRGSFRIKVCLQAPLMQLWEPGPRSCWRRWQSRELRNPCAWGIQFLPWEQLKTKPRGYFFLLPFFQASSLLLTLAEMPASVLGPSALSNSQRRCRVQGLRDISASSAPATFLRTVAGVAPLARVAAGAGPPPSWVRASSSSSPAVSSA